LKFIDDRTEQMNVAALEQIAYNSVRSVLSLRPQSQTCEQTGRLAKELPAGVGVASHSYVRLNLSHRPGKELVQAVHQTRFRE
jgi:hypothetical protein